jgi:putative oxidoreductase
MKKASTISRILLGLLFLTFGLNGFLQFIKLPPLTGAAAQFMGSLFVSHELVIIMALQVVVGALLQSNRFTALALAILAPIIVNIVLFHAFMALSGLPFALIAATLWVLAALGVREVFAALFSAKNSTLLSRN